MCSIHTYHLLRHPPSHVTHSPLHSLFSVLGLGGSLIYFQDILGPWNTYCCSHYSGPSLRLSKAILLWGFPTFWGYLGDKTLMSSFESQKPSWGLAQLQLPPPFPSPDWAQGTVAGPPLFKTHPNNFPIISLWHSLLLQPGKPLLLLSCIPLHNLLCPFKAQVLEKVCFSLLSPIIFPLWGNA